MKAKWIALGTLIGALVVGGVGLAVFLYSGVYDIAAIHPHSRVNRTLILTLKRNSVQFHAGDIDVPELNDPQLVRRGFVLYRENCVVCHGAPGEARSRIGKGLNPNPPPLENAAERWTAAEIAWIVTHGLKMAGMPGFALGEEPDDLWALTAFVQRMNTLTPAEYRKMLAVTQGELADEQVSWVAEDQGWETLAIKGDREQGRSLARDFGCGTCHRIPGIGGANGMVGPPLEGWAQRHYIAGALNNSPSNLVSWIMDAQQVEPGTVMPDLGVREEEAWDIAAYLYSLGNDSK